MLVSEMPDTCFALVGEDGKRSIRVCNSDGEVEASLVESAIAKVEGLAADVQKPVKAALRKAWKKANPGKQVADAPAAIQATEPSDFYYDDYGYVEDPRERMEKTDDRVNYRASDDASPTDIPQDAQCCYNCRFYDWGTCSLVEGTIEAHMVSDLFQPMPVLYPRNMMDVAPGKKSGKGSHGLLMKQAQKYATPPDWIEFWPAPGRFNHPTYGEIVVTKERNDRMVDNFYNSGYQTELPVDIDHDLAWSGAVGWIKDMRVGSSGSVEARVEWTENGTRLIEEDRFKYFSPSLLTSWSHTVTGELVPDVAIGGAICNDPYFKDSWLRPLVASEGQLYAYQVPDGNRAAHRAAAESRPTGEARKVRVVMLRPAPARQEERSTAVEGDEDKGAAAQAKKGKEAALTLSDAEVTAFREFVQAGGMTAFAAQKAQIATLETEVQAGKAEGLRTRFMSMVRGKGGEDDGAPWIGTPESHVRMLMHIAETEEEGEESQLFQDYVANQRMAAQADVRQGSGLREFGSGKQGDSNTATGQVAQLVAQYMKEDTGDGDDAQKRRRAMHRVSREHAGAYRAYREEAAAPTRKRGSTRLEVSDD